jgi:translation initiation factor 3 subunit I
MRPIVLRGHTRPVTSLVFSKEGDLLFSGSTDKSISAWYADNGERLGTYAGHNGMVTSVDVSHNTTILASGAADGEARLWDVQSGACTRILKHSSKVTSVAFSLGSQYLLTANDPWKGACQRAIVYEKM